MMYLSSHIGLKKTQLWNRLLNKKPNNQWWSFAFSISAQEIDISLRKFKYGRFIRLLSSAKTPGTQGIINLIKIIITKQKQQATSSFE